MMLVDPFRDSPPTDGVIQGLAGAESSVSQSVDR